MSFKYEDIWWGSAYVGIDFSLNGTAAVAIDDMGRPIRILYTTDKKKYNNPNEIYQKVEALKKSKDQHRSVYNEIRKFFNLENLTKFLTTIPGAQYPFFVALEDYAYGAISGSVYQIAENVGILKHWLAKQGLPFKTYSPQAVKIFATGRGNAKKKDVVKVASNLLDLKGLVSHKGGDVAGPGIDIADAFFVARMLRLELLIRREKLSLENIEENARKAFLTGKRESCLDAPFIKL